MGRGRKKGFWWFRVSKVVALKEHDSQKRKMARLNGVCALILAFTSVLSKASNVPAQGS